ncbi:bifunctional oligoribonuclease/PAP phosphatase NrnA [Chloroflexota bacterium]
MSDFSRQFVSDIDFERLEELRRAAGDGPVLILTHDNPDPDALASGKVLARLFAEWGLSSRLAYSGLIERVENKAMLALLTPEWEYIEEPGNLTGYSCLVLVDTQPRAGNNSLPYDILPDIVIDHHLPLRDGVQDLQFVDVRPEIGATVSMVYQYLHAAGIQPDPILATAIFYGIHADTRGLSRCDSKIDQWVYFQLLSLIDRNLLIQVEQAGLPREYFRAFCNGLQVARFYQKVVTASLGEMHRPDFGAEMADMLIRLKETEAVLCLGWHHQTLYLSMRTKPSGQDAGLLIQHIVLPPGKAGGHGTMAGGQVPLLDQDFELLSAELVGRFLAQMGEKSIGQSLLV